MEQIISVYESKKLKLASIRVEPQRTSEAMKRNKVELLPYPDCFFKTVSHVLKLASYIGLNLAVRVVPPILSGSVKAESKAERNCSSSSCSWRLARSLSIPSISNIFFLISYMYMTTWIYYNLERHLGIFFHGVDYYALAVDVIANFMQVTVLLLHARIKGSVLVKLLNEIRGIHACFQNHVDGFAFPKRFKYFSVFLLFLVLTTSLMYGCLFLYIIFGLTCNYIDIDEGATFPFVIQKLGHFSLPFYFQTFVALFIVITEIIREFFVQLADQVSSLLKHEDVTIPAPPTRSYLPSLDSYREETGRTTKIKLVQEIEFFRLTFERLRSVVETVSKYFGICLLTVCSISVVSITAAVYTIILNQTDGGITDNVKDEGEHMRIKKFFFLLWGYHLYFAFFSLGAVLICGQRVTDASLAVAKSIQESSMNRVGHEAEFQINLMLNAINGCPVEISACAITKMSMGFVASAVGNVVTYILVLLQFKSSCVKS